MSELEQLSIKRKMIGYIGIITIIIYLISCYYILIIDKESNPFILVLIAFSLLFIQIGLIKFLVEQFNPTTNSKEK